MNLIDSLIQHFDFFIHKIPTFEHILETLIIHKTEIFSFLALILGFSLGGCWKASKLENSLNSFLQFTKSELKIRESQKVLRSRLNICRNFLFVLILSILAFIAIKIKRSSHLGFLDRYFTSNKLHFLVFLALFLLVKFILWFRDYRLRQMETWLMDNHNKKRQYLVNFLNLMGTEMKEGILEFEGKSFVDKKEKNYEEISKLNNENSVLQSNFKVINSKYRKVEEQLHAYINFYSGLTNFNWCESCFDEEAINTYISKIESIKTIQSIAEVNTKLRDKINSDGQLDEIKNEKQPEKIKHSSLCKNDCLIKYHLFCGSLSKRLNSQISLEELK